VSKVGVSAQADGLQQADACVGAAEMLARVDLHGYTVIADKGFAGHDH